MKERDREEKEKISTFASQLKMVDSVARLKPADRLWMCEPHYVTLWLNAFGKMKVIPLFFLSTLFAPLLPKYLGIVGGNEIGRLINFHTFIFVQN